MNKVSFKDHEICNECTDYHDKSTLCPKIRTAMRDEIIAVSHAVIGSNRVHSTLDMPPIPPISATQLEGPMQDNEKGRDRRPPSSNRGTSGDRRSSQRGDSRDRNRSSSGSNRDNHKGNRDNNRGRNRDTQNNDLNRPSSRPRESGGPKDSSAPRGEYRWVDFVTAQPPAIYLEPQADYYDPNQGYIIQNKQYGSADNQASQEFPQPQYTQNIPPFIDQPQPRQDNVWRGGGGYGGRGIYRGNNRGNYRGNYRGNSRGNYRGRSQYRGQRGYYRGGGTGNQRGGYNQQYNASQNTRKFPINYNTYYTDKKQQNQNFQ